MANGFTLEIHDRGLGMTPEALLDANLRLAETPEFELSDTDRLGLFVVSRLAQRHSVKVVLQPSPYGGTTAVVFLPVALLTDAPETNGNGVRLDGARAAATSVRAASPANAVHTGRTTPERPAPVAVERAPSGRPLPAAELRGPVELEAPLVGHGLDPLDGLDDPAVLDDATPGITRRTGAAGRPVMATLDDETPPNGTPRSALLGLRPADRPHTDRHTERGGARKNDRDRESLAPTGPVRLETHRVEASRPDAPAPREPYRCRAAAPPRPWSPITAAGWNARCRWSRSPAPPRRPDPVTRTPHPARAPAGCPAGSARPAWHPS